MNVKVRLFASYRDIVGARDLDLVIPGKTTVGELLNRLVAQYPALTEVAGVSRCVVNQEYVVPTTELIDGDEVVFLPPVSGGDYFSVTRQPLDVQALLESVADDAVGGAAIFVGTVRRLSRGKRVQYLEYDAYEEMAERKLAEIGATIRDRWQVERVSIQHRFGRLEIGEAALVVAVGAAHRQEAFEACRFAVEEIKHSVPVWKKEVWEDGEVWVGLEGG